MPEEEKKTEPEAAEPAGSPPGERAAGQPDQVAPPHGLTPEDLEAVLRAAGVQPDQVAAGTDQDVADMAVAAAPLPGAGSIEMLKDVALDVRIELGRAEMLLEDVLRLGAGSVLTLSKLAGDAVDVLVNGQLVARGEVMVLDDNFCVRVTEIVSPPVASGD